jgi:hypothetical protein
LGKKKRENFYIKRACTHVGKVPIKKPPNKCPGVHIYKFILTYFFAAGFFAAGAAFFAGAFFAAGFLAGAFLAPALITA